MAGVNSDLLKAADDGDFKATKRCLKNGAELNLKMSDGTYALKTTESNGHSDQRQ